MHRSRSPFRVVLLLLAVALLSAGCGGGEDLAVEQVQPSLRSAQPRLVDGVQAKAEDPPVSTESGAWVTATKIHSQRIDIEYGMGAASSAYDRVRLYRTDSTLPPGTMDELGQSAGPGETGHYIDSDVSPERRYQYLVVGVDADTGNETGVENYSGPVYLLNPPSAARSRAASARSSESWGWTTGPDWWSRRCGWAS